MLCLIPQLGAVLGRGRYEGKDGQEIVMDCQVYWLRLRYPLCTCETILCLPRAVSSVKERERKRNLCTFGTNVPLVTPWLPWLKNNFRRWGRGNDFKPGCIFKRFSRNILRASHPNLMSHCFRDKYGTGKIMQKFHLLPAAQVRVRG